MAIDWFSILGQDNNGKEIDCLVCNVLEGMKTIEGWPDPDLDGEGLRHMMLDEARLHGIDQPFSDHAANVVGAINAFVNSPNSFMEHPQAFENFVMTLGGQAPDPDVYEFPSLSLIARGFVEMKRIAEVLGIPLEFAPGISVYVCMLAGKEHLVGLPEVLADFDCESSILDQAKTKQAREMAKVLVARPGEFEDLRDFEDPETYSAARFADIEVYARG